MPEEGEFSPVSQTSQLEQEKAPALPLLDQLVDLETQLDNRLERISNSFRGLFSNTTLDEWEKRPENRGRPFRFQHIRPDGVAQQVGVIRTVVTMYGPNELNGMIDVYEYDERGRLQGNIRVTHYDNPPNSQEPGSDIKPDSWSFIGYSKTKQNHAATSNGSFENRYGMVNHGYGRYGKEFVSDRSVDLFAKAEELARAVPNALATQQAA